MRRKDMKRNEYLWTKARKQALEVSFLETKQEIELYTNALYLAMEWGSMIT